MRAWELTAVRKAGVKWLAAGLLAASCSAPVPAVVPSPQPARHRLLVVAAGADGPVAGLRVCASTLSGTQSCAPTGPDGTVAFALPPDAYQVRSEVPASQRRLDAAGAPVNALGGAPVGADLTGGDASVRLAFEKIRRISGTISDVNTKPVGSAPVCANPLSLAARVCDKSKADGTYVLDVTPGLYKISFDGGPGLRLLSQWAYGRVDSGEADVIDVRSADAPGVDVQLRQGFTIQRTITTAAGTPVQKARACTHRSSPPLPADCRR